MSEITLVRQATQPLSEAEREAARKVMFGFVDGLGEQGRKAWRRFFNGLLKLEPGEMVDIRTHRQRSGPFHRRHMLIEQRLFEAQERFDHFEQFRNWLKVGAGFCDWIVGPKGGVIPVPKSISFAKLEEDEMRAVHDDMIAFVRTPHAIKVMWPKAPDAAAGLEEILREFDE